MKFFTIKFFALCALFSVGVNAQNQNLSPAEGDQCGFVDAENRLRSNNPKRLNDAQFENWLAPKIKEFREKKAMGRVEDNIIQIPVVVHVIHDGDAYGVDENITDSQVQSQLTVMTEDFRRMMGTPGYNDSAVGADVGIEFVLAKQTPDGCPTNGINRVNMGKESWSEDDIDAVVKPSTIWDPEQYMNMWSIIFTRTDLLGYAQFPSGSSLDGLNNDMGPASSDGVVCRFNSFGSVDYDDGTFHLTAPYNHGRTMTHEVGHYLGLRHIWGDGDCSVDDYVTDTPLASQPNRGCPVIDTCTEEDETEPLYDMVQNYMDYTNDECMNIFTEGQKERILTVLANSPRRVGLVTSNKDEEPTPVDNDPSIALSSIDIPSCGTEVIATVDITNFGTTPLKTLVITSEVDNGASSDYNWTGTIAPGASQLIDLPGVNVLGGEFTYTVSVSQPNGKEDNRSCNNEVSQDFKMTSAFASTSVINLELKTDKEGSETSWEFLDGNGDVIERGGGNYWGNFTVKKSFEVDLNQCYTFVIYDSGANGLCCTNGEGYYTLTADDGTVIFSGAEFALEERVNISTRTLSVDNKEFASGISLYPNPTRSNLNLKVSNSSELPTQFAIYNMLGQLVKQKQIHSTADLNIGTSELKNGMYFIKVSKGANTVSLPFIKE